MIKNLKIDKFRLFEDEEFSFGKHITAISGQNAIGKSTLLGLIGNIVELKEANIFGKYYRTDFSRILKGSPEYDKSGEHRGTFYLSNAIAPREDYGVNFRSTWQNNGTRFRVIPKRKDETGKQVDSKFPHPVMYLGLSRLYPIGETTKKLVEDDLNLTEEEKNWFTEKYSSIFSMPDNIKYVTNHRTSEVKSNFTGVTTEKYDALCNSAGQDNLGQILLSILSFKRLKDKTTDWKGGLLIIDELDATLHPVAQQKLINTLFKEAKENSLQIVFTTHSLSSLEFICEKYEGKRGFSDDFKLIFISNANQVIKIYHNPSYELIKNNLCLTHSQKTRQNKKLLVYSEDDDTRWFFKKLIYGYAKNLKLVKANLGCNDLEKLLKEDPDYFSTVLFVVDGDVKTSNPQFVKKPNVLALIDKVRPEEVLYNYLNSDDCTFWEQEGLETQGMTKQFFITENGPLSTRYRDETKKRKKFSKWFYDQKHMIEQHRIFEHWKKNNSKVVEKFRADFIEIYNKLADLNDLQKVKEK